MATSEKFGDRQYFSDLVFREPDLRAERDARTVRVLKKALLVAMILLGGWAVVYAIDGLFLGVAINSIAVSLMLTTLYLLHLRKIDTALHLVFWVGYATIWSIVICFDGPAFPVTRMSQFWFIFLAAAGYMAFGQNTGRLRDIYALICGCSFITVHFDPFHFGVVFALDQSVRQGANVAMLVAVISLISFLSWLFVSDILDGEFRLDRANARLEELLQNMLPHTVAERLKNEGKTFADGFSNVSILFTEIVGFSEYADRHDPNVVVSLLDKIFSRFDELSEKYELEKIKTVGGMYMVVSGVPESRADHADVMARFALDLLVVAREISGLEIRIGINSGPVVAGVIGSNRLIYDLWGDSVNIAQRMQMHGLPGRIQVSEPTYQLLRAKFKLRSRGEIQVKGKGAMQTYILDGTLEVP